MYIYVYICIYICVYVYIYICMLIIEGSLEVKLPTIWRDEKAVSREKSQKRRAEERRR